MKSLTFFSFISIISSVLSKSPYDVIIVGAGPSGIAAASTLLKNDVKNFLILEAEDRIGGRINSVKFGEKYIDLGAEWVQGDVNNLIYNISKDLGIIEKDDFTKPIFLYSNKVDLPQDMLREIYQFEHEIYNIENVEEGVTMGEFARREFKKKTKNMKNPEGLPNLLEDALEHFKFEILAGESAFDWDQPSAASDSEDFTTANMYHWKGNGYKTVFDVVLQKIPDKSKELDVKDKIFLGKTVRKINWDNQDDLVKIECEDGSEYESKRVIFTPSLGVLQKNPDIFEPNLSESKRKTIQNLGIGAVAKIWLRFDDDWWNKNEEKFNIFQLVWEKNMRENFTEHYHDLITSMAAILPSKTDKILAIWCSGKGVPLIETVPIEELSEGINFVLNQFLGQKYKVLSPVEILRTNWYSNPNFRGSYSYQTIESRKNAGNVELGKPIKNKNGKEVLLMAGEATSPEHYGTVHGAMETGIREARRILE